MQTSTRLVIRVYDHDMGRSRLLNGAIADGCPCAEHIEYMEKLINDFSGRLRRSIYHRIDEAKVRVDVCGLRGRGAEVVVPSILGVTQKALSGQGVGQPPGQTAARRRRRLRCWG